MDRADRIARLASARLYFVCDAGFTPVELDGLVSQALAGGADIVQLRDKHAPPGALRAAAGLFRDAAAEAGALFIVNDEPALAAEVGADGVHVGQDDTPVEAARELAGEGMIVGLSSHEPSQLDAALASAGAARPDYVSIGPVWETPTKAGRPAAGLDYVRYAAERLPAGDPAALPWFAIGAIDVNTVAEVREAGARRIVVVRAIRDADEPLDAARELRDAITAADAPAAGEAVR
jgi:thiamine-phosphate pyrophosphorylase